MTPWLPMQDGLGRGYLGLGMGRAAGAQQVPGGWDFGCSQGSGLELLDHKYDDHPDGDGDGEARGLDFAPRDMYRGSGRGRGFGQYDI